MNASIIIGTVGALVGVALGSWITGLSQRRLAQEARAQENIRARQDVYVEYLAAYRRFRRFVQSEPIAVDIAERPGGRKTPVIAQSTKYWEAVEAATARINIIATDKTVLMTAENVRKAFYSIAEARATYDPGTVPDVLVRAAKDAEKSFAQAAHDDLRSP